MLMITLSDTHDPFMGHCTYSCNSIFLGKIYIGRSDKFGIADIGFLQSLYRKVLRFPGKTSSHAELGECGKLVFARFQLGDFILQTFPEAVH